MIKELLSTVKDLEVAIKDLEVLNKKTINALWELRNVVSQNKKESNFKIKSSNEILMKQVKSMCDTLRFKIDEIIERI